MWKIKRIWWLRTDKDRKTERQKDRKTKRQKDRKTDVTNAYLVDEQRCDPDRSKHNGQPDKSPEGLIRSNVEPAVETRLFTVFFDCHFESVYVNEEDVLILGNGTDT